MKKEKIVILNNKGQKLIGYFAKNMSKRLIIFCHGIVPIDEIPGGDEISTFYHALGNSFCYFDFTGFGKSEGEKKISIEQQVEDIGSVIKALHKDYNEIVLYGVSLGAIATAIAAQRNKQVTKLVLVNGLYYPNKYLTLLLFLRIKLYLLLQPSLKNEIKFAEEQFHPEQITVPTYVVYGEHDKIINPEQSKHVYEQLTTKKELIKVTNGDHFLMKKEYAKDLEKLFQWLS